MDINSYYKIKKAIPHIVKNESHIKDLLKRLPMQNYHRHSSYSNPTTPDCSAVNEDFAKRAVELKHNTLSSCEHGNQGNYWEIFDLAKKYNLKFIFASEPYWVKNRFEKDRTNAHIILMAKTENGRQSINEALSEANDTGYYYKPRLDLDLLLSLPQDDVVVTSACVAFWQYEEIDEIVLQLHRHFKNNFYLEVQNHMDDKLKTINKHILDLHKLYNIQLIAGLDSHYIFPEQAVDREYLLKYKGIIYEDEQNFYLDYPSTEEVYKRFKKQGILNDEQILNAINNTNIVLEFDDYDHLPIFNKDKIKLPTLYPNKTEKEKNKMLYEILKKEFIKVVKKEKIPKEQIKKYVDEIKKEYKVWVNTGMTDYALINYALVKDAEKNGGLITDTGRGSGVSYYTNKLLGFTKIDRIASPIKLYPERFISESRIIESKSMVDLDLNCGNPEIFAESQEKLLGKNHVYPMIAYGTLKIKSAWKMYAGANDVDFNIANAISQQIEKYEKDFIHADEEDKSAIDVLNYIDEKYHKIFNESKKYRGIINDKKRHPCAYILYQGDIRREIGLIKCKSENSKKEYLVTMMDGAMAEKYKLMKNDLLKVDVVMIIKNIYKNIGIKPPTIKELAELMMNDKKIQEIYSKGITLTINQVEKKSTTQKIMRYKPKNISELTAFVAAIRPGFQSMYKIFESKKSFNYDIPSFDRLIQTPEMPNSFILYQEMIMTALSFAGIHIDSTYEIIKALSKKKAKVIQDTKEKFIKGFSKHIQQIEVKDEKEATDISKKVWTIIESSIRYLFNAAHAYSVANDSAYCAHLKSHYPYYFYEFCLNYFTEKGKKDKVAELKKEMVKFFNIKEGEYKLGLDNRSFKKDEDNQVIYPSLSSIKSFSKKVAEDLFNIGNKNSNHFFDVLVQIKASLVNKDHLNQLVKIGYFSNYGGGKKILKYISIFNTFYEKKQVKVKKIKDYDVSSKDIEKFSNISDSGKTYTKFRSKEFLLYVWNQIENEDFNLIDKIVNHFKILNYTNIVDSSIPLNYAIISSMETNKWGTNFLTLYRVHNGTSEQVKIYKKTIEDHPLKEFDMIKTITIEKRNKKRKVDDKWISLDETELILSKYAKVVFNKNSTEDVDR